MQETNDKRNRGYNKPAPTANHVGKLPPQARDMEEAVLGAIMLESYALLDVADMIIPEIFYVEAHSLICKTILSLQARNNKIDILTVAAELRQTGELEMVGGAFYITELTNRVASSANIEFHVKIIQQKYIQRELIRISAETIAQAYEDTTDVLDLLSKSEFQKDELLGKLIVKKVVTNSELLRTTKEQLKKSGASLSGITGVPSGFSDLDKITGGWQKSDLIILAARPAMGKTSLALQCATNAAIRFNRPTAVFSLEMSMAQLMHKEMSIETKVPLWKFKKAGLDSEDWSRIDSFDSILSAAPIFWDDTAGLNIIEFVAKARRLKRQHDIQLIVIDYLQLLHGITKKGGNREQEVGFISRTLKAVAKELDIPVIALSQLSRALESRPGGAKRPMLSDLRESGSIEQDADMVLFLYRDEYYGITEDSNGNSTAGLAEVQIAKYRNGPTGDVILRFDKETTGFNDDNYDITAFHAFNAASGPVQIIEPPDNFTPFTLKPNEDFDAQNYLDDPPF